MRGRNESQVTMLSLVTPDQPPAPEGEGAGRRSSGRPLVDVRRDVQQGRPALDSAGAVAEIHALDGVLQRAERAALLRAARLQPAVPMVSRHGRARGELRPIDVLEEPAATAR